MDAILTAKAERLASEMASQARTLEDLNGLMRSMMKSALERMLNTELDVHLGRRTIPALAAETATVDDAAEPSPAAVATGRKNRRNGHSRKSVQGDMGELTLATPRDRNGTFEPQLIAKHQRRLSGFDEKIMCLYAKGMTTRDIQDVVKELYGVDVSPTLVSEITADLDAEVTAWRTRRLDSVWPIVYLDGIMVHVRGESGRVRRTQLRLRPLAVLGYPRPEPFLDQAEDPSVGDPVLEELEQPSVVDGVEESTDVRIEHPVHLLPHESHPERVQRIMRAATGSEAVGEAQEVDLVDLVEHRHHGLLDDLVLQGRDAQRSHAARRPSG